MIEISDVLYALHYRLLQGSPKRPVRVGLPVAGVLSWRLENIR